MTAAAGLAAADGFLVEPHWLRVIHLDWSHLGFGQKIVHFTDVHHTGNRRYLKQVIDIINHHSPDLACFTGDLVSWGDTRYLPEAIELCREIKAPLYGVPGNHDPWDPASVAALRRGFATTGGAWLVDESLDLGPFALHGSMAVRALRKAESKPKVLLCHYPAAATRPADKPYAAILSGHSHGGQVRVPLLGAPVVPDGTRPYVRGEYQTPLGRLFVSAGIGTTGLPVRFLCRPDIAVIQT